VQVPAETSADSLVGITRFAHDARGPPLASLSPRAAWPSTVRQGQQGGDEGEGGHRSSYIEGPPTVNWASKDGGGANSGGEGGAGALRGDGQEPVGVQSSCSKDGHVAGVEENLTPE